MCITGSSPLLHSSSWLALDPPRKNAPHVAPLHPGTPSSMGAALAWRRSDALRARKRRLRDVGEARTITSAIYLCPASLRLFREHVNPQGRCGRVAFEGGGGYKGPQRTQARARFHGRSRVNTRRGTAWLELGERKVLLMQPHDREIAMRPEDPAPPTRRPCPQPPFLAPCLPRRAILVLIDNSLVASGATCRLHCPSFRERSEVRWPTLGAGFGMVLGVGLRLGVSVGGVGVVVF